MDAFDAIKDEIEVVIAKVKTSGHSQTQTQVLIQQAQQLLDNFFTNAKVCQLNHIVWPSFLEKFVSHVEGLH